MSNRNTRPRGQYKKCPLCLPDVHFTPQTEREHQEHMNQVHGLKFGYHNVGQRKRGGTIRRDLFRPRKERDT